VSHVADCVQQEGEMLEKIVLALRRGSDIRKKEWKGVDSTKGGERDKLLCIDCPDRTAKEKKRKKGSEKKGESISFLKKFRAISLPHSSYKRRKKKVQSKRPLQAPGRYLAGGGGDTIRKGQIRSKCSIRTGLVGGVGVGGKWGKGRGWGKKEKRDTLSLASPPNGKGKSKGHQIRTPPLSQGILLISSTVKMKIASCLAQAFVLQGGEGRNIVKQKKT